MSKLFGRDVFIKLHDRLIDQIFLSNFLDKVGVDKSVVSFVCDGGYCVAHFNSQQNASKAIGIYYTNIQVEVMWVDIDYSIQKQCGCLVLDNLPSSTTYTNIIEKFQHFGTIIKTKMNVGKGKTATIIFREKAEVESILQLNTHLIGSFSKKTVAYSKPIFYDLMIYNMSPKLTVTSEFYAYFESYGRIENFQLMEYHDTKVLYISYTRIEDAERFIEENDEKDIFQCNMPLRVKSDFIISKDLPIAKKLLSAENCFFVTHISAPIQKV